MKRKTGSLTKLYRGSNVQTLDVNGIGLGLYISEHLCESYSVDIFCLNLRYIVGRLFIFISRIIKKVRIIDEKNKGYHMASPKKYSVLIVEDEEPLRKALAEEFADAGYQVYEGTDGLSGLEVALKEHPDIILLDQLMPKLNGVGMLRQLRTDTWGATVPVIMATNMSTTDTINEAIDAGANDYFIKSEVSVAEILQLVATRLEDA